MTYLSNYISEDETTRGAPEIYQAILAWLRTPEAVESGGVVGMMNRADINLRLRSGMTEELQKAIMPVEEGATEAKICGGCADEILCVRRCLPSSAYSYRLASSSGGCASSKSPRSPTAALLL